MVAGSPTNAGPPSSTGPVSRRRRPVRRRTKILTTAIGLVVVLAIAYAFLRGTIINWNLPDEIKQAASELGYDLQPQRTIAPDEALLVKTNLDWQSCRSSTCANAYEVFTDPYLTHELSVNLSSAETGWIFKRPALALSPAGTAVFDVGIVTEDGDYFASDGASIGPAGQWALGERYYLVERVDADGEAITPKVTPVNIDTDAKLATPVAEYGVSDDGGLVARWEPVADAESYRLLLAWQPPNVPSAKLGEATTQYAILGETKDTEIDVNLTTGETTSEFAPTGPLTADDSQNLALQFLLWDDFTSQDDYYDDHYSAEIVDYVPAKAGLPNAYLAVQAFKYADKLDGADLYSPADFFDATELLSRLPVRLAANAAFQDTLSGKHQTCPMADDPLNCHTTGVGVVMADGKTLLQPVHYDVDAASQTELTYGPDPGHQQTVTVWGVPYTVAGSRFGALGYWANLDDATKAAIEEINTTSWSSAGDFDYGSTLELMGCTADPAYPSDLEYPVNGSSDLVKFIAANAMAGSRCFSLNEELDKLDNPQDIDLANVMSEAVTQNPYILGNLTYDWVVESGYARFDYPGSKSFRDGVDDLRQQLYGKGNEIVADIITDAMSERSKARAIDQWLSQAAKYDDDAFDAQVTACPGGECTYEGLDVLFSNFPNSWRASGVIFNGAGVCSSYAQAYKLLADLAGLQSVVITGVDNQSGEYHAWLKVYMEGRWQIVDPTWDDYGSYASERYFGLSDAAANRSESDEWMAKDLIPQYAAP